MHINGNDELEQPNLYVCVCVLNTNSNVLRSHIPPKERYYTASLKGARDLRSLIETSM